MKIALSVAAVLAAAGAAQAAFTLTAMDFSNNTLGPDGSPNMPITASADFVQSSTFPGDNGSGLSVSLFGDEYSSAVWFSGTGVTTNEAGGTTFINGRGPDLVGAPDGSPDIIRGNTLDGGWLVDINNAEQSGDNGLQGDANGFGSVLVSRLSVPVGESIDFAGSVGTFTLVPNPGDIFNVQATINGGPVSALGSSFELVSVSRGVNTINPAGTEIETFDIFVNEVPTPGAVTLAGLAGLAGLRRRR